MYNFKRTFFGQNHYANICEASIFHFTGKVSLNKVYNITIRRCANILKYLYGVKPSKYLNYTELR